jgi:hypothetical protein
LFLGIASQEIFLKSFKNKSLKSIENQCYKK